jgi:hypothetical protein
MTAPRAVKIQEAKLTLPYRANAAGRRNIPEPIMFPGTKAVRHHNPKEAEWVERDDDDMDRQIILGRFTIPRNQGA